MSTCDLLQNEFQKRIDYDFVNRSKPGIIFYGIAWPLLFSISDFYQQNPFFCWVMASFFVGISLLRYGLSLSTKNFYTSHPDWWRKLQAGFICTHAALWSVLFFSANTNPHFAEISTAINLLTAGIASASVISFTPKFRVCIIYNFILIVPTAFALTLDVAQWNLGLIIWFFCFYLIYLTHRNYREYTRAFKIEWSLQEKQEELQTLSQTDFLTKTYNRLFFNEQIAQQWYLAQRNRKEIALLMIDLDHFKNINDKYGHMFGDECLIHTAKIIKSIAKRRCDTVVRYGGEEFAIILPQTDIASAIRIAESIRQTLSNQVFEYNATRHPITASVGVCAMLPIGNDYKVILQQADEALYKAKKKGRNRVEISELNQYEDVP